MELNTSYVYSHKNPPPRPHSLLETFHMLLTMVNGFYEFRRLFAPQYSKSQMHWQQYSCWYGNTFWSEGFLCNSSAAAAKPYRWSWLVNGTNLDRNKDCRCGRRGSTSSTAQQIQIGRRATSHSLGRTILHKSRWCSLSRRFWKNNLHLRNINGTYINYWAFTIHESKQTTTWNRILLLQAAADGHGML